MNDQERRAEQALESGYADVWDQLEDAGPEIGVLRLRKDRQLNLRVDTELLTTLRSVAAAHGQGYHTFARRLIEEGVAREHLATDARQQPAFSMKEAILLLLNAPGSSGRAAEPIEGRTRLQKLLFLLVQHMKPGVAARFEAYDHGPFDDGILGDVEFLAEEGLIESPRAHGLPVDATGGRGQRVLAWASGQAAEAPQDIESYRLTHKGMEWVERFFRSDQFGDPESKRMLADAVADLKLRHGHVPLSDLVDYVYEQYPEYTSRSAIRHKVAERIVAKKTAT